MARTNAKRVAQSRRKKYASNPLLDGEHVTVNVRLMQKVAEGLDPVSLSALVLGLQQVLAAKLSAA
ncbi:MAG TPA: hypothetical protein VHV55_24245 [Pirellulales bacterium]|jgi:hypothetical protein|nr:hypothetical protein [Pirellulales bacterium]